MILRFLNLMILLIFIVVVSFANASKSIKIQNHVRIGYDDNLSNSVDSNNQIDSLYVSDIINITSKFIPSPSSTFLFFYQPEFTYRFDADDKNLYLQDMYINYVKALSSVSQLQVTDRFRISEPDINQIEGKSFTENNINISYQKNVSRNVGINLLAGYTSRKNEDNFNSWNATRDFERIRISYLISRMLDQKDKAISVGLNFNDHEIKHDGGSLISTTLFGGYDYPVNKKIMTSTQLGYTFGKIEGGSGSSYQDDRETTSPFFEAGLNYKFSKFTDINTSYSYSLRYTTLSTYNAEVRSDWLFAIRHKFTSRISSALSYSLVDSNYESDFLRNFNPSGAKLNDKNSIINFRTQYKINNNHSLEVGLQLRERNGWNPAAQDYTRNKLYIGWKLNI